MPTLLRLVIAALSTALLLGGTVVIVLGSVDHQNGWALLGASLGLSALAMPPLLAGSFVSYWSWDASARRRLRIGLTVLVTVQVVGVLATLLVTGTSVSGWLLVVLALLLDVVAVLLGRTARRIELRRSRAEQDPNEILTRIRIGWRRGAVGAIVGLAAGGVLMGLLLGLSDGPDELPRLLIFIPALAGLGASVGMVSVVVGLARRIRDLLGGDVGTSRRIGRAVRGKEEDLTDDEQRTASRFAGVAPAWLRLQTTQGLVNALASICILVSIVLGSLQDDDGLAVPIAAFSGVMFLIVIGSVVFVNAVRVPRIRAYAAAHPA